MRSTSTGWNFFHQYIQVMQKWVDFSRPKPGDASTQCSPQHGCLCSSTRLVGWMDPTMRFGFLMAWSWTWWWIFLKIDSQIQISKRPTVVRFQKSSSPSGCTLLASLSRFQTQDTNEKSPFHAVFDCQFDSNLGLFRRLRWLWELWCWTTCRFLESLVDVGCHRPRGFAPTATKKLWGWKELWEHWHKLNHQICWPHKDPLEKKDTRNIMDHDQHSNQPTKPYKHKQP